MLYAKSQIKWYRCSCGKITFRQRCPSMDLFQQTYSGIISEEAAEELLEITDQLLK